MVILAWDLSKLLFCKATSLVRELPLSHDWLQFPDFPHTPPSHAPMERLLLMPHFSCLIQLSHGMMNRKWTFASYWLFCLNTFPNKYILETSYMCLCVMCIITPVTSVFTSNGHSHDLTLFKLSVAFNRWTTFSFFLPVLVSMTLYQWVSKLRAHQKHRWLGPTLAFLF